MNGDKYFENLSSLFKRECDTRRLRKSCEKVPVGFVMSFRPSVRIINSDPSGRIFEK